MSFVIHPTLSDWRIEKSFCSNAYAPISDQYIIRLKLLHEITNQSYLNHNDRCYSLFQLQTNTMFTKQTIVYLFLMMALVVTFSECGPTEDVFDEENVRDLIRSYALRDRFLQRTMSVRFELNCLDQAQLFKAQHIATHIRIDF